MRQELPAKIAQGTDSRRNWRTVNGVIDHAAGLAQRHGQLSAAVAPLLRRPLIQSGGNGDGSPVELFILHEVRGNYLRCRKYEQDYNLFEELIWVERATDVFIAKPFKLRASIDRARIDEVTYLYTYADDSSALFGQERYASPGAGNVETQVIVPRYLPKRTLLPNAYFGDVIHAVKVSPNAAVTTDPIHGSVTVEYVDVNVDGRAWARKFVQP